MTVIEFKFKNGRKIKWIDENGNDCSIVKTGIISDEFKGAMRDLAGMIAFHLDLPVERITGIGLVRSKDDEGFDAFNLVGNLYSVGIHDDNVVMAKKLRKEPYRFFPYGFNGYDYFDEDGNILLEADVHLPENHKNILTNKEWEFCEKLMDMAGKYALEEDKPVQPTLFDAIQEDENDVDEEVEE